jgi:hypothetical protein
MHSRSVALNASWQRTDGSRGVAENQLSVALLITEGGIAEQHQRVTIKRKLNCCKVQERQNEQIMARMTRRGSSLTNEVEGGCVKLVVQVENMVHNETSLQ